MTSVPMDGLRAHTTHMLQESIELNSNEVVATTGFKLSLKNAFAHNFQY